MIGVTSSCSQYCLTVARLKELLSSVQEFLDDETYGSPEGANRHPADSGIPQKHYLGKGLLLKKHRRDARKRTWLQSQEKRPVHTNITDVPSDRLIR